MLSECYKNHHIQLEFTKCFRLSADLANMLGRIWHKKIIGVNGDCLVEDMSIDSVVDFLAKQEPSNILCLGQRNGDLSKTLNILEERYPEKFNKSTVYASISERDARGATEPDEKSAIFTTYDSSKGLERSVCIVFDFTESYWSVRINKPQVSYEILRNIFCVAASRGKKHIIFAVTDEAKLSESTLSSYVKSNMKFKRFEISEMFDFKYKEDIEDCFKELKIKPIELDDKEKIEIAETDGLIDLSPCIGIYQEAVFFDNYDIDVAIKLQLLIMEHPEWYTSTVKRYSLDKKILYLTALETNQNRYRKQVKTPFVTASQKRKIIDRLKTQFVKDEQAQVECKLHFSDKKNGVEVFPIVGYCDVLKNKTVYELKYVSELMHEHYLQCACYMMALGLKKGILWNTKDNHMFEIKIQNEKTLKDKIIKTITKGAYKKYYDAGVIKDSFFDQLKERRR